MKKQILYYASVALAAGLAACSSDELEGTLGYDLKGDELAATIVDAASSRVNIDGKDLKWTAEDEIGVFDSNNLGTYRYKLTKGNGDATAVFKYQGNKGTSTDFTPAVAYYPYSASTANATSGKFFLTLKDEFDYTAAAATEVKMPMIGDVEGQNINFTNLAAVFKFTVVNMPGASAGDKEAYTRVALISQDAKHYIAGSSTVNVKEKTLTMSSSSNNSDRIVIKNGETEEAFTEGESYDFYFVVPAGEYPDGLSFAFGIENQTDGSGNGTYSYKEVYTPTLEVVNSHLYKKTLRFVDGELQDDTFTEYNDLLAGGQDELTANLTSKSGTIFIPSATATSAEKITLNLTLGASGKPVTIAATSPSEATPEVVVNLSSATDATAVLNINLPESAVTLNGVKAETKAGNEEVAKKSDPVVTLGKVVSSTSDDALFVGEGVKISTLTVKGGNVYLDKNADVTFGTDDNKSSKTGTVYVFTDGLEKDASTVEQETGVKAVTLSTYQLMYPKSGSITLEESKSLDEPITIGSDKVVTLDLAGNTLTGPTASTDKNVIIVEGNLTVNDNGSGSITSGSDATDPTILVRKGGKVTFNKATISNAAGTAVQVTGANSSFDLVSGNLSSTVSSSPLALDVMEGASATLESASSVITGGVSVNASTANIKAASISGTVDVEGTGATGTFNVGSIAGKVSAKAGTTSITATTSLAAVDITSTGNTTITSGGAIGAVTVSAGSATLNATGAVASVTVSGGSAELTAGSVTGALTATTGGKLILNNGAAKNVIVSAGAAAATQSEFKMVAGSITPDANTAAIAVTGYAKVDIEGGTLTASGTAAALSLTSTAGAITANIKGNAILKAAQNVIALTGNATNKIDLTIEGNADLQCTASSTYAAIAADATASNKTTININGGKFSTNFQDAISVANGSVLNITAGTFAGSKSAIKLAEGTLNVSEGAPTFTGANVIDATTATAATNITLKAADAKYTATGTYTEHTTGYVLLNYVAKGGAGTDAADNNAKIGTVSISAGRFIGDVESVAKEFIEEGGKFSSCKNLEACKTDYLKEGRTLSRVRTTDDDYWEVVLNSIN
jgi:hypothetical protein